MPILERKNPKKDKSEKGQFRKGKVRIRAHLGRNIWKMTILGQGNSESKANLERKYLKKDYSGKRKSEKRKSEK